MMGKPKYHAGSALFSVIAKNKKV